MVHTSTLTSAVTRGGGPNAVWASGPVQAFSRLPDETEIETDLDEALDDSFPASDPPSQAQPHPKRWLPNGEAPKGDADEAPERDPG